MKVPIDPPITVPAVSEKTFDQWFFPMFSAANLNDDKNASLSFAQVPQNSETKECLWSERINSTGNFWDIVANVPSAATAMGAVLAALPDVKAYLDAQEAARKAAIEQP